ncbi:hypothetical protein ACH4TU_29050 [Streptomyces physcomitrii]|uniref:hypothetical protein n=1 Tax=Streptomyces physcomitrii TaxID=2724184 RepID=UPI00058B55A9
MLDGRGQREDLGRARKDADGPVGLLLEQPSAGRCEEGGVHKSPTDQDVRPGGGFGGGGLG